MRFRARIFLFLFLLAGFAASTAYSRDKNLPRCKVAAERLDQYLPLIKNKRVAVVANPTSVMGNPARHIVDVLRELKINITVVFAPEHGFRGEAGAGENVTDGLDPVSGVKVISLYGKKTKPSTSDLKDVDVLVFDIQDVGVRFYTYISTLQHVMEACADASVPIIVLDRPNPNGYYVDGPVLDTMLRSFVGMNPIPVVHGCTIGEYALMVAGEGWLKSSNQCTLKVIPIAGYTHATGYRLPVKPSPNLTNQNAIYLYPSLCFFEGTRVSIGRGTGFPFETYGFPEFLPADFSFLPKSIKGRAEHPPYEDTVCFGMDLRMVYSSSVLQRWFLCDSDSIHLPHAINLKWVLDAYGKYPDKKSFFSPFFDKLAGTRQLRKQIESGASEKEIRDSWEPALQQYLKIRKKYLLYPDFRRK